MTVATKTVWVKICGTTNVADAELAASAGANAIGFIFAPGPRRVTPGDARNIIARLPATVERIAVFVNEQPEQVREIVASAGMTAVQLHGDESPEYVRALFPDAGKRALVIKAIRMDDRAEESVLAFAAVSGLVDAFLLDSASDLRGGSGKTFAWDAAVALMRQFPQLRFIVAGGLRPDNVQEAVRQMRPWGVDVVSGVEQRPGIKREEAVRSFIDNVREVEATL